MVKSSISLVILIMSACVVTQAGMADEAIPLAVQFVPGCAPWDGAAYEIELPLKGEGIFKATVWGEGLNKLQEGEVITLVPEGIGDHNSNGYATFCPEGQIDKSCFSIKATIDVPEFPADTGSAAGRLIFMPPGQVEEKTYKIETHIADNVAECG